MSKLNLTLSRKRALSVAVSGALLALSLSLLAPRLQVSGANPASPGGDLLDVLARQQLAIVGSWDVPDPEGIPILVTFNADGTLVESDADHTFSGGHGTWVYQGGGQYAYTWLQVKRDDQEQRGKVVVYGSVRLDATRNQFSGPLHFEFTDTTGKVDTDVSLGLELTLEGTRVQIRQ